MTRTQLILLPDEVHVAVGEGRLDLIGPPTDDHVGARRAQRCHRVQQMRQHRPTGEQRQGLGLVGFQPFTKTGGENADFQRVFHAAILLLTGTRT
ncbi:MAG: hypothetical protein U5O39_18685 [Gammaproteobacteria bacterium]|nr:hypothetical protein [Gammaproteobacteria bacterium]